MSLMCVLCVCVCALTSDGLTPGRHLPEHQGHGVDVGLLEGLDVLQVESGLQHLRSHVARRAHLRHRDTPGGWTRRTGHTRVVQSQV